MSPPLGIPWGRYAVLAALVAGVSLLYLAVGQAEVGWRDLLGDGPRAPILWQIRLPRLLLAMGSGGALALAGLLLQTWFQNPMADSYVIGASTGATLGAVIAMLGAEAIGLSAGGSIPPVAFVFSMLSLLLVYRLSLRGGRLRADTLLLTGIAVSLFGSALTSLIMIRSEAPLHGVVFWLLGSFNGADWAAATLMLPSLAAVLAATLAMARPLNLLMWGDETAAAMGVDVARARRIALAAAALLTAMSVSLNGVITFVGLIVPHIGRLLFGVGHGRLAPACVLLGALLMATADLIARTAMPPAEIPIGVVTALLGVPFFIHLLRRSAE